MMMTIANNFVSERNSSEVMAVGLNAIREICSRAPLAMSSDLLQDLVQYKTTKNKTVMMAARSLMHLFRDVDPTLLHKKDRGEPSERGGDGNAKEFAALKADSFVPGAEILQEETDGTKDIGEEKMDEDKEWETDDEEKDDDDDDSDGWVDIVHSDEEMNEEEDEKDAEEKEIEQADAKQKAEAVSSSRILTDEDFKKIQTQSLAQQVEGKGKK